MFSEPILSLYLVYVDILIWSISLSTNIEASRGAEAQSVIVNATGCEFDPHSRNWNIYLNLYFHSFALVSRGFEFRHSTRNAFRIRWKVVNGVS